MELGTQEVLIVLFIITLIAIFLIILVYRLKRILIQNIGAGEYREDDAFNVVSATQGIINNLKSKGIDVSEAQALVKEARDAIDLGQMERAITLAQAAKGQLVALTAEEQGTSGGYRAEELSGMARLDKKSTGELKEEDDIKAFQEFTPDRFKEKHSNKLPAQFTIKLAREEIDRQRGAGKDMTDADEFLEMADAAFSGGEFDEALKLANKAKRAALGERVEGGEEPKESPEPVEEAAAPEEVTYICPSCDAELKEGDNFCPKCGVKIEIALTCDGCGNDVGADDLFCRKCGNKLK